MKRETPTEEDAIRISDYLLSHYRDKISDRASFNVAYSDYMQTSEDELEGGLSELRDMAWNKYSRADIKEQKQFKEAGGKSLTRDRRTTAETVVTTRKEYRKRGASEVDLKGFDTKKRKYSVPARLKGKVVYTRKETITVRNKSVIRYRDRRGRFASHR